MIKYEIINLSEHINTKPLVAAIGNFNGFHIGHQELLKKANQLSSSDNQTAVITFKHLPQNNQILSLEDECSFLRKFGISLLITIEFNDELRTTSASNFISFLLNILKVKDLIVGEDFTFGFNKSGNIYTLQCSPINTIVIPIKKINEIKVSSTNIIKLLQDGNIDVANKLLGYQYGITGLVQKGYQNGHKIGFPTINLKFNNYVKIKDGVYATLVIIDNKKYLGMGYVGVHKTIDELTSPLLEVNIFDFNEDIYGKEIKVLFLARVADSYKFASLDILKNHLKQYQEEIITKFQDYLHD